MVGMFLDVSQIQAVCGGMPAGSVGAPTAGQVGGPSVGGPQSSHGEKFQDAWTGAAGKTDAGRGPVDSLFPDMSALKVRLNALVTKFAEVPTVKDGVLNSKQMAEFQGELFAIQLEAQDMSLKTELLSKLAEHGTSSTKTVLQTQA